MLDHKMGVYTYEIYKEVVDKEKTYETDMEFVDKENTKASRWEKRQLILALGPGSALPR